MSPPPIEFAFCYCPRCAVPNDQTGAIPFKCSECGLTLYFGPVAAVGGLVMNDEHELLLVCRARDPGKGLWGLPGGFIDRDETAEEALKREVHEETGLGIQNLRMTMTYPNGYKFGGIIVPVLDLFIECDVIDSSKLHLADGELAGCQWKRPTTADLDQMAFHSNRLAVEHWLETRR